MPHSPVRITLFVPELLWPVPEATEIFDGLDCPALSTLLARGHLTQRPPQSPEATLADRFGYAENTPYAAFRRLGEHDMPAAPEDACWIAADPVHLRFQQERLILADGATLGINADEAALVAEGMNRHFGDIGRMHVATPERWYLHVAPNSPLAAFTPPPLSAVTGRSIERLLPEIMPDRAVRALLNEIQTFLHAHPVNQRREDKGLLPINSLWLWGAGALPPRIAADFDGVWSNHPLATGLARAAGVPTHPVPVDAAAFLTHAAPGTHQLVELDDLADPVQHENGEAYRNAIANLERRWFAPLRQALAAGRIAPLRIEAATAYATLTWESGRRDTWKFWRRPRPLIDIARKLANSP